MGKVTTAILKKLIDRLMKSYGEGLSPAAFAYGEEKEFDVKMRDGVSLFTKMMFPKESGDYPILFVRSPYVFEFDYYEYIFQKFVSFGFIVCFQHCRGRGKSKGEWQPFEHERFDGQDTLAWLKAQDFYTKKIVPVGISYLAMNQLLLCDMWDDDFKTAVLAMYGGNLYDLAYENGMFREEFFTTWALQNNGIKTYSADESYDLFKKAAKEYPRKNVVKDILHGEVEYYNDLINNPSRTDGIWDNKYFMPETKNIKAPLCLLSGWYDFTCAQVIDIYNGLGPSVREKSALLVGPWTHLFLNKGDKLTPRHDIAGFMGFKFALKWLLKFFYGAESDVECGFKFYAINKNHYVTLSESPQITHQNYYIGSKKKLTHTKNSGKESYMYNVDEPVATTGGRSGQPVLLSLYRHSKQCCAVVPVEYRDDILKYASEPLKDGINIFGGEIELEVSSTAPDSCFSVKLCAEENQRFMAFAYGITSIVRNDKQEKEYTEGTRRILKIKFNPVSYYVKKGSRLALFISSSDYPSFNLSLNTSAKWADAVNPQNAKQTVYFDNTVLKLDILDIKTAH